MAMYRIRNVFSGLQGAPYLATHYFDASQSSAQQAVTDVGTFWTAMDANLDSELTWATEAQVDTINESNGALVSSASTTPATGTGGTTGPVLPFASQGLVRWSTSGIANGRRVRGRTFVPGITELGVDNGVLTAAVTTSFNAAANALATSLDTALVIWHRPTDTTVGTFHPTTGGTMWNQLAVLRSRRD